MCKEHFFINVNSRTLLTFPDSAFRALFESVWTHVRMHHITRTRLLVRSLLVRTAVLFCTANARMIVPRIPGYWHEHASYVRTCRMYVPAVTSAGPIAS